MRYCLIILIFFVFFVYPDVGQANNNLHVSAQQAILMDQSTGEILYEKNAHEPTLIASITKIMTALIAIESGKENEVTTASLRAINTEGSSIYLEQGEKMRIEDLVYGLMLRSGNDAAIAISEHVGGSVEGFVYLMNEKAKWLGMLNTQFDNPHGLDAESHYSSAYDMAVLMRNAASNELFQEISGTHSHQARNRSYAWQNKNRLLTSLYENTTGGKTGYTKNAGRTLVTTANKNDVELIAVTLNAPDDWQDHTRMYEWGFNHYEVDTVAREDKEKKNKPGLWTEVKSYVKKIVGIH